MIVRSGPTIRHNAWHGSRPYAIGDRLHEFRLPHGTSVSFTKQYDHLEDLEYSRRPTALLVTGSTAIGFLRGDTYVRIYLGFGQVMIGWNEEFDWFDQQYPVDS